MRMPTPSEPTEAHLPERLTVPLAARSYEILVGEGLLARAGALMRPVLEQPRVFVVSDENVAAHYLGAFEGALAEAGIEHQHKVLPAGEPTKSLEHLDVLVDTLLAARVERQTTVVALGGGVIGDLAGFAASIVLRGLPYIQVPTTLLAQVDSSVGGKTGINSRHGKNLIGAFHQPALVLADVATLETLPARELRAGYAETVKYGLIEDADFFAWLEKNAGRFFAGDRAARRHAILESCAAKAAVVGEDERETGRRALLNLGHTFAHAFEKEAGYDGALLHGEAVAVGMAMAFELSARTGLCPPEDAKAVRRHLDAHGLPAALSDIRGPGWTAETLMAHMTSDKKVRGRRPTFVLARGIGRAFTTQDIEPRAVEALLAEALSSGARGRPRPCP